MLKKSRTKFLKVVDDAARINYNKQSHSFDGLEFVCELNSSERTTVMSYLPTE